MGWHRRFLASMSVVLLFTTLNGCQREDEPARLDFDTDPRILRGVWTGENEKGETLRLAVRAEPPYDGGYAVEGEFELNGEDLIRFSGGVAVPVTSASTSLSAQVSPTCGLFVAFAEVGAWELCGDAPEGSPPRFELWLSDQQTAHTFTVTKLADTTELPQDEDAPVATDAVRYTPQVSDDDVTYTVEATYTNATDSSVYLPPCGYDPPAYGLYRLEGGSWHRTVIGGLCPAVGGVPDTELEPGESFTATLDISAVIPYPAEPQFGIDLMPGVHRLSFVVTNTERTGDADVIEEDELLPLEQRVSNAFELVAP